MPVRTQCLVFGPYLIKNGKIGTHLKQKLPTDHHSDATNSSKGIRSLWGRMWHPDAPLPSLGFGLGFLVCFNKYEIQGPETSGHLVKVTQHVKARARWDVPSVSPLVALGGAGPRAAWQSLSHHIEWSNPDCQVSPSLSQPCSIGARQGTERLTLVLCHPARSLEQPSSLTLMKSDVLNQASTHSGSAN